MAQIRSVIRSASKKGAITGVMLTAGLDDASLLCRPENMTRLIEFDYNYHIDN